MSPLRNRPILPPEKVMRGHESTAPGHGERDSKEGQ